MKSSAVPANVDEEMDTSPRPCHSVCPMPYHWLLTQLAVIPCLMARLVKEIGIPIHNKVISGFQALRQAKAPVDDDDDDDDDDEYIVDRCD
ncbi:hypothetical protein PoB_004756200 [Plakobranchus ocellatus]|uniref:Uncharacterized protein n=1 Tax=Plakobranchus ocellatus TaxID=259542 RepID=A0AAV4BNX5_9GAST|nr:hypothetical protein PoB_004756200 [Plakobranchus ocellatus]